MKKIKKILSILLSIALMLSNFAFADSGYDIKGHWAETQVNDWILKGYVRGFGDGSIKPDSEISRVEFVVMVNRAFGFAETENISFKDVKAKDWFYSEVAKARKAGYITGFSDGTFRPNGRISRQEAALILARLFKLEAPSNTDVLADLKDFSNIASWSVEAVSSVIDKGYMQGMPDKRFLPSKAMTRAEAIVTLGRCYLDYVKAAYDKAGIYTAGTVEGSVEIKAADVTLRDTVINGDLIIDESVGDGNVWLKNVTVKGDTFVRGGGLNSVVAEDSAFKLVIIDKADNKVRFVTAGNTVVDSVDMKSGGKLEEQGLSGSGIATITISRDNLSSEPIILVGRFDVVDVKTANLVINVSGDIEELKVASAADNTSISLSAESKVKNLVIDALAVVTGTGKIDTAQINVSGTKVEAPVTTVKVADGVTNVVANAEAALPIQSTTSSAAPVPSTDTSSETTTVNPPNAVISYYLEKVFGVDSTMEYTTDNWVTTTAVEGTTIGIGSIIPAANALSATMKIRYKETPSAEKTLTIPARPAVPNYVIDFLNERVNSVSSADEYWYDDDPYNIYIGTGAGVTVYPSSSSGAVKHIYFRKQSTANSFKSAVQSVTIPVRPSTEGLSSAVVGLPSGATGTRISGNDTIEVSIIRSDGFVKVGWESCVSSGKDYANAAYTDKVLFRVRATDSTFSGDTRSVYLDSTNCVYIPSPVPVISGVAIAPGSYKIGDSVAVTINADASTYTQGKILINGQNVSSTFNNLGDKSYRVTYIVKQGERDNTTVTNIPISVILYNENTPCSAYINAPTSSGAVTIDANPPMGFSIRKITSTNNGIDGDGKSKVTVTWPDSTSTDVNHYEVIAKVGTTPQVADTVAGLTSIAKGVQSASFDWNCGEAIHVGIVAYDNVGNYIRISNSVTVLADGVTTAGEAANIKATDLDTNNDASDLQVQFNAAADEDTVSEYRVMVVFSTSAVYSSLSTANAVAPGNYRRVDKLEKAQDGTYTVSFAAGSKDVNGDVIHTVTSYRIFILSVADGTKATINSKSEEILNVRLTPGVKASLLPDDGIDNNFKFVTSGDYSGHAFSPGTAELLDEYGGTKYYVPITGSGMYYTLKSDILVREAGDQITVTDIDGNGVITISLLNPDNDNSLDGTYTLEICPDYMNYKTRVLFTISGSSILVTATN